MKLSPAQHTLLCHLRRGPIRVGCALDNRTSRRGLQQRGFLVETEGQVHLTPAGQALFGAAFTEVVTSIAAIQAPKMETEGSCTWTPVPTRGDGATCRLRWAKERGEIQLFFCVPKAVPAESMAWSVTDLVDPIDLRRILRPSGVLLLRRTPNKEDNPDASG
jgi:hypothetical protein